MPEDPAPFRHATLAHFPPERTKPVKIFCAALDRAAGEFWLRLMYASTVKMHIPDSQLTVYWRDDRPEYKAAMLALCPYVDRQIRTPADGMVLGIDWLYTAGDRHKFGALADAFRAAGHAAQDIMLIPSNMLEIDLLRYPAWPRFRLPDTAKPVTQELARRGVGSNQSHVVIHYREPTYPYRGPTPYRDVTSDEPFLALRDYLIDEHGLTVARIGHSQMREWPARDRFIDLSRDPFIMQAAAISHARFCVMTMSGPASIPNAFGVPAMVSNAVGYAASGADPGFLLPKHLISPAGQPVELQGLVENGQWTSELCWKASLEGYTFRDNTLAELCRGVDALAERTANYRPEEPAPVQPMPYSPQRPYMRAVNVRTDLIKWE